MTQTALEALERIYWRNGDTEDRIEDDYALVRAALTAPVGLETREYFGIWYKGHIAPTCMFGTKACADAYWRDEMGEKGTGAYEVRALNVAINPTQPNVTELVEALEPFALISSEGVVSQDSGHVTITTCAEYFHRAAATLSRAKGG